MSMFSVVRFLLCVEIPLVLAVVHWLSRTGVQSTALRVLLGVWVVVGYLFQFWFTYRFTHHEWVA
jgi:hypothetical protein